MVPTVAYHYVVTREGRMFERREIINKGSHVHLQNTRKIGIVCVGDDDANWRNVFAGEWPSGDAVPAVLPESLRRLSRVLMSTFPIRVFGGHKEFAAPVFEKL